MGLRTVHEPGAGPFDTVAVDSVDAPGSRSVLNNASSGEDVPGGMRYDPQIL
jgi:hypothetical protein